MKVAKESFEAVIFTSRFKVTGMVHVLPQERLTDFMTASSAMFLPITNAVVRSIVDNKVLAKTQFLNLNKNDVTIIYPTSERLDDEVKL